MPKEKLKFKPAGAGLDVISSMLANPPAPEPNEIEVSRTADGGAPLAELPPSSAAPRATRPQRSGRTKTFLLGARFEEGAMKQRFNDVKLLLIKRMGYPDLKMQEIMAAIIEETLRADEEGLDWIIRAIEDRRAREAAAQTSSVTGDQ